MLYSPAPTPMWHVLHLIARPIEALLGVFCVLSAIVLYPDEEGKIQSKFEDFWVKVDDFKNLALTRHAAFMTQVAKLETRLLNRVFGQKLISGQALGVSFCFSAASVSLFGLVLFFYESQYGDWDDITTLDYVASLLLLFVSLIVGAASIFIRKNAVLRRSMIVGAFALVGLWKFCTSSNPFAAMGSTAALMLTVTVGGFVCDVAFISLIRRLLLWSGKMTSSLGIAIVVILTLFLAFVLLYPLIDFMLALADSRVDEMSYPALIVSEISLTNIFDGLLAMLFVLLALVLLIHRAIWPLLTRTLFRMTDIGTKGRRAILTTVGFAFLAAGISGKVPELVQKVIEKFGG
jgi:hypothetical protein